MQREKKSKLKKDSVKRTVNDTQVSHHKIKTTLNEGLHYLEMIKSRLVKVVVVMVEENILN